MSHNKPVDLGVNEVKISWKPEILMTSVFFELYQIKR